MDDMNGGCACSKDGCKCGGGGGGGMWMMHKRRHHKPFFGLLALAAVAYLIILSRNAIKAYDYIGRPTTQRDTIAISAQGKVTALTDIATVNLGVLTEKPTVAAAMTENTTKMNAIIAKMKDLGIAKEDIQTTNYSVSPMYSYPTNGKPVISGYQVNATVTIKIRKLDGISDILAAAGTLGANQITGPNFDIDDPEALRQQARIKGLEMAKKKAQDLANAAGVRLGKVVGFSESASTPPSPIYYAKDMALAQGGAANVAPDIQSGSQEVTVDVTVQYEILP